METPSQNFTMLKYIKGINNKVRPWMFWLSACKGGTDWNFLLYLLWVISLLRLVGSPTSIHPSEPSPESYLHGPIIMMTQPCGLALWPPAAFQLVQ